MARLLLVDDEDLLLGALKGFFESLGLEVQTANTGEGALAVLETYCPQILLLDLNLEGSKISGLDVLTKTKQLLPQTVVLIASGYVEDAMKAEALQLGADQYFEKPLQLPVIAEAVQAVVAKLPPS